MNCPYCKREMKKGSVTFMATQGFSQILCSYTAAEEKSKGIFKRKSQSKVFFSGEETEGEYCPDCRLILPLIQEDI